MCVGRRRRIRWVLWTVRASSSGRGLRMSTDLLNRSSARHDREYIAQMLQSIEQADASNAVTECEMGTDHHHVTQLESERLETESREARVLDQKLALDLRRRALSGQTSSAAYLQGLGDRPRLPQAVERRLVTPAQAGDRQAKEELVEAFLPLIAGVARVYRGSATISRTELMQEGVVGLLRALERFDTSLGVPFWGYASWWVRQAMQQLIAELTRPMVLSDRALRNLAQLKRVHGEYLSTHGREPTGNQLAADSGLSHVQVGELLALDRTPQPMEEPVAGADSELGAFGELLADPLSADAYEQLLDHSEIEQVRALLGSLNERERVVLRAHYGLDGPEQSLRDIGEQLGLSGERVRQIEDRALGKLRAAASRTPPTDHEGSRG
jgi:RNA polymerase primary sigma factor